MSDSFENPYTAPVASPSVNPLSAPVLYKHSGKVPVGSMVLAACILVPLAILMGVVYSAAVVYLPFIKLRGLITLLYGGALGAIAGWLAYQLKFRNNLVVMLMGLAFAFVSYYSAWAVHPALVISMDEGFNSDVIVAAIVGFLPQMILGWMEFIYTQGLWGMGNGGNAVSGFGAVAIWLFEAAVIFGTAWVARSAAYGDRPFCEICNRWTDETQELAVLPVSTADPAWQQVRMGNLDALKKLQISTHNTSSYVELRMAECPTCESNDFLSAIGITLTVKDGNVQKNESPIFRHMSITDAQREEITDFATAMAEAVAELSNDGGDDEDDIRPTITSTPDQPV
ncbi:hypothetical protein [Stieleria varia]|uniref:Uncharacterized protein n=1 Tax=Stieleria varia TaxID=2528005 RepID=A0A5C6B032_9BACT|nr:hypothetical protein [Stieleria varia]TWU04636.1 hypothetical protein Pla52n_26780 [Stieleria varia]